MTDDLLTCGICGATIGPVDIDSHTSGHVAGVFVNVWNCQAQLCLSFGIQDGQEYLMYLCDEYYTERLRQEMEKVVRDQGGGLNLSGRYYVEGDYPLIKAALKSEGAWRHDE